MLEQFCYEDKDVMMQSLHPLVAILYMAVVFTLALLFNHPLYILGVMVTLILAVVCAESVDKWEIYLTIGLWMAVLIMVINPLFSHEGRTVLFYGPVLPLLGPIKVTLEAVCYGAVLGVRILAVLTVFALYNAVVHPDKTTNLFARFAYKSALVISLSTRMVPSVGRDLVSASEVQQMRGIDFNAGNMKERMRKYSWLLNVLVLSSLEGALQIAEAMQARGFGSGKRSIYRREQVRPRDYICGGASLVTLGLAVYAKIKGYSDYLYYPQLGKLVANKGVALWLLLILFGLLVPVITGWGWKHWHYLRSKI